MKYHPNAGTPVDEVNTLAAMEAIFLRELAAGKYKKQVAAVQRLLGLLGTVWPPAKMVSRAITVFVTLNRITAPNVPVVADGKGGFVPISNSRYDPKTGRFVGIG